MTIYVSNWETDNFDRSVVLIGLADKLVTLSDEKSILNYIYEFMTARLKIIGSIKVCNLI